MHHEMIAAGPAAMRAVWAPNSQPEPMIEPAEAQSRPMKPISRRRPVRRGVGAPTGRSVTTVAGAEVFMFASPGFLAATAPRPDRIRGRALALTAEGVRVLQDLQDVGAPVAEAGDLRQGVGVGRPARDPPGPRRPRPPAGAAEVPGV